ncbi:MAG: hypothetical protein Q8S03_09425 [Brevundimonas sp.]|nr:hypothetical protein [Brevundimonas sp.]MDP3404899.1 hypothetical protein [Brevundimonas sp.]
METETEALIRRWIVAFCEVPILIDPELMRGLLADAEARPEESTQ